MLLLRAGTLPPLPLRVGLCWAVSASRSLHPARPATCREGWLYRGTCRASCCATGTPGASSTSSSATYCASSSSTSDTCCAISSTRCCPWCRSSGSSACIVSCDPIADWHTLHHPPLRLLCIRHFAPSSELPQRACRYQLARCNGVRAQGAD
jgi:hypothetical protein